MEKQTFYIDECGNTGSNFMDSAQPFYIYGGWLLKDEQYVNCQKELKDKFLGKQAKELKAKKFFYYDKDGRKYSDIFWTLINKYEAVPIFQIVEKKYMLGAKIVETFFDPEYNHNLNKRCTFPGDWKKDLACKIAKCEEVLEGFNKIITYKDNTLTQIKNVYTALKDYLYKCGEKEYALLLENLCDEQFKEMLDEFNVMTNKGVNRSGLSLVLPMLNDLLKNVELYARVADSMVFVVHDELRGYDEIFQLLENIHFEQYKTEPEMVGGQVILIGYPHITGIRKEKSEVDIMIQMADLLCGFIHYTLGYSYNKKQISSEKIIRIWKFLIDLHDNYTQWHIHLSDYYSTSIILDRLKEILSMYEKDIT